MTDAQGRLCRRRVFDQGRTITNLEDLNKALGSRVEDLERQLERQRRSRYFENLLRLVAMRRGVSQAEVMDSWHAWEHAGRPGLRHKISEPHTISETT